MGAGHALPPFVQPGAACEHALLVYETAESLLTPLMVRLEAEFPLIKVFSLPSVGDAQTRRHIELGREGRTHGKRRPPLRTCAPRSMPCRRNTPSSEAAASPAPAAFSLASSLPCILEPIPVGSVFCWQRIRSADKA